MILLQGVGGGFGPCLFMELVEFTPLVKTGDAEEYRLVVKDDQSAAQKRMMVSGCALRVAKAGGQAERRYSLVKHLTEAERDLAYAKYGDDWLKHCPWRKGQSPNVQRIAIHIVNSHPELFGGKARSKV